VFIVESLLEELLFLQIHDDGHDGDDGGDARSVEEVQCIITRVFQNAESVCRPK